MHAIRNQRIEPCALVHFIEMRQRLTCVQNSLAIAAADRRAIRVVEHPFDQVARWQQVLEPLLVLNANGIANRNHRRCALLRYTSCIAAELAHGFKSVSEFLPN